MARLARGLWAPPGDRRPLPVRGDWMRQLAPPEAEQVLIRCWDNVSCQEEQVQHVIVPGPAHGGRYHGPVHAVDHTDRFVAVEVPHPDDDRAGLVWFNVWTSRNHREEFRGVAFCRPVPPEVLLAWQRRGWVNRFLWRQEESEESEESLA